MLTRIGGSRIRWVTRSSSLTDSTVSSATSRPKRHCDLPHEEDHSDGPPPRSRYVSTDPHLIRLGVSFPLRRDQQRRKATSRKWIRQELRSQPGELVEGEFVHPSALSWGTLALFMKEEDDGMRLCVNSSNWVRSQSEETIHYFK
ncbi:hypothetical protein PIB30_082271 [Stylosanthes scabra]|uniref:Uncharacterized protein n=1 Tax=Stylosanthes scabra TaxID=79078 RepID=A0ABU6VQG4_9FABA|nr:hypothetical protein [Stylosanthes scabra]